MTIEADRLRMNLYFSVEGLPRTITELQNESVWQKGGDLRHSGSVVMDGHTLARHLNMLVFDIDARECEQKSLKVYAEKKESRLAIPDSTY